MKKLVGVSAVLLVVAFVAAPAVAASIKGTRIGPARLEGGSLSNAPNTASEEIVLSDGLHFCCLLQELDAGHARHPVVGQQQRGDVAPHRELAQSVERIGPALGPHDQMHPTKG